jgi:hypothetical protein
MGGAPSKTVAVKATLTFEHEVYRSSAILSDHPDNKGVVVRLVSVP